MPKSNSKQKIVSKTKRDKKNLGKPAKATKKSKKIAVIKPAVKKKSTVKKKKLVAPARSTPKKITKTTKKPNAKKITASKPAIKKKSATKKRKRVVVPAPSAKKTLDSKRKNIIKKSSSHKKNAQAQKLKATNKKSKKISAPTGIKKSPKLKKRVPKADIKKAKLSPTRKKGTKKNPKIKPAKLQAHKENKISKKDEKKKTKKPAITDEVYSSAKNDTMKVYMQEIGQISLVTKEQEVDLAAKIHGNNPFAKEQARTELIKANLRLVVKIAHDFKGLGLPLLDLISEGNIGLMRAVEKFDPAKGAKFSSYAAWWIKQSMRRALANQSKTIRIPVQSAGKINKIKNAKLKLTEKLSREPSDAEIAEFLEFSERTVSGLKLADLKTFSLHDPIQQGEDGEFQDIIPDRSATMPDRILGDRESIARLNNLLTNLDDREKHILRMRFGLDGNRPKTLEEVSQEIGRTRERVRQIQNQALTKLKTMLSDETGVNFD